jgi:hypothetical protein
MRDGDRREAEMPRHDPPRTRDFNTPHDQITPEMSAAAEARELARTEDLSRRLDQAHGLDQAAAFELGYDVRSAARKIHRDVEPYEPGDPRRAAFEEGAAMALAEIDARSEQVRAALRAMGRRRQNDGQA